MAISLARGSLVITLHQPCIKSIQGTLLQWRSKMITGWRSSSLQTLSGESGVSEQENTPNPIWKTWTHEPGCSTGLWTNQTKASPSVQTEYKLTYCLRQDQTLQDNLGMSQTQIQFLCVYQCGSILGPRHNCCKWKEKPPFQFKQILIWFWWQNSIGWTGHSGVHKKW